MSNKALEIYTQKTDSLVLEMVGGHYVISTTQRMRADLVWATRSVRHTLDEAQALFAKHKRDMLKHTHCIGDESKIH